MSRPVPDWPDYYLDLARATSARSKDPNTQVGAAIVNPDGRIVSQGYNGMPEGMCECWDDDTKDENVIHAELNAVANAARSGVSTLGATMYITLPPCKPCARVIAAAGIKHVVFPLAAWNDWVARKPKWQAKFEQSLDYLKDAGVTYEAR